MIYIARDGKQQGPYPLEQINGLLASGQLRPEDLSWWEGAPEWMPVSKAPGVVLPSAPSAVSAPVSAPLSFGNRTSGTPAAADSPYAPPRGTIAPGAAGFSGQVSPAAVLALRQTRPWVLFLAVLAAIGAGFMILVAIIMLVGGGAMIAGMASSGAPGGAESAALPAGFLTGIALIYLVLALLYLYPITRLFKYSSAISRLTRSGSSADLEDALRFQKSFWKFVGVVTLIAIVLWLTIIGLMIALGGSILKGASSGMTLPPPSVEMEAAPFDSSNP